jgi:hypothetical protein
MSLCGVVGLVSAVAFASVFMVGCGGSDDSPSGPGNGIGYDSRLILPTGYAWVFDDGDDFFRVGVVLKLGGSIESYLEFLPGMWIPTGDMMGMEADRWWTRGDRVYLVMTIEDEDFSGNVSTFTDTLSGRFTVSGGVLTVTEDETGEVAVFRRTEISFDIGGGDIDPRLSNTMWENHETFESWTFVALGPIVFAMYILEDYDEGIFEFEHYSFATSGNTITLTPIDLETGAAIGAPRTVTYSISGDTLILDGVEFEKMELDMHKSGISKASKLPESPKKLPRLFAR